MNSSDIVTLIGTPPPEQKENASTLPEALDFTRYNVHIKGRTPQAKQAVQKAIQLIEKTETPDADKTQLCKQVIIFYLFLLRDEKQALYYLDKLRFLLDKSSEDYMDTNLLVGYARTISGINIDLEIKELKAALFAYGTSYQTQEIKLKRALVYYSIGLTHYHCAMQSNDENKKTSFADYALTELQTAQTIQEGLLQTFPPVKIELVQTLCAISAVRIMQKNFATGFKLLRDASAHLDKYCEETGANHPVHYLILQTEAALTIQSPASTRESYLRVCGNLSEVHTGQHKILGTAWHVNFAELLHLYGDLFNKLGMPEYALSKYELSLQIKEDFYPANSKTIQQTEHEIALLKKELAKSAELVPLDEKSPPANPRPSR